MWQNFEVILQVPEPVYCPQQYWFMIDEYSVPRLADSGKDGKVFFCPGCESQKEEAKFCRGDTDFAPHNAYPEQCIGCTFKNAHYTTVYKVKNYAELRKNEMYALACAYHIYLHDLHDLQPADDLMEFIRRCCPIAYKQVGKVVSSYGGIRCTPSQALDFPLWRKAKQLTWDRAYDEFGNLCYIAYYDAGNAAHAGFIKTLLSPQERVQLFRGSENPLEELLGDVFELALGKLTFALRWPGLFERWGEVDTINACINGLERCFSRYSARESLMLITSGYPRKRKPAKADPEIEWDVQDILRLLPAERFIAVPTGAALQPDTGVTSTEARASYDAFLDTLQGVEVPRLVPDEVLEPDGQPDEENQVPEAPRNPNVADVVKAKAWDALRLLFNGEVWVDENTPGKICILCGSPDHVFSDCRIDNPLRQQTTDVFEHVKKAVAAHPDAITFPGTAPASRPRRGERASGSNDQMDVESVASSERRPKAKARPRQNNLQQSSVRKREELVRSSASKQRRLQLRVRREHLRDGPSKSRLSSRCHSDKLLSTGSQCSSTR